MAPHADLEHFDDQYSTVPVLYRSFDAHGLLDALSLCAFFDGSPSRLGLQLHVGASNVKFVHPMATEREI